MKNFIQISCLALLLHTWMISSSGQREASFFVTSLNSPTSSVPNRCSGDAQSDSLIAADRVVRISTEQGLASTDVWSVLRGTDGFMWFGTMDGLHRYDGYKMKVFKRDLTDPASLGDSAIRTIYEDSSGTLWIGTWFGGLNRFERETETFTRFQHDPADPTSLSSDSVYVVFEDRAGHLWLGTRYGGLNRFDVATGSFTHYRHDPNDANTLGNDNIFAIAEDQDGTLWLGTDAGLDHFNPTTGTFQHYRHDPDDPASLSSDLIRSLFVDESGTLWIGTWGGGLSRFDGQRERFVHYRNEPDNPTSLSNDAVKAIKQAADGALWIGTWGGGLNYFDPHTGMFQRLEAEIGERGTLAGIAINDLMVDAGMLWLVTTSDIFVLDLQPKCFLIFRHDPNNDNSLASNEVDAIYEDPQGILWVSTASTGLNRIDRVTGEVRHFQENPDDPGSSSANEIWEIAADPDGTLWLATAGSGLDKFDPRTEQYVRYRHDPNDAESLGSDRLTSVLRDQSGVIWVGTIDAGLDRFDPATGIFIHFEHDPADPTSLSDNAIMMLTEDHNGDLWIGTIGGGLNRYEPETESFTRFQGADNAPGLPADGVNAVLMDREERLWVGTIGGGLARLNVHTGEVITYNQNDNLPSNTIFSILEDDQGRLWLSTGNGLSRFNPNTETFRNYDVYDGLPANAFEASTAFQSPSGEMFFASKGGLLTFYPEEIRDNPAVPPVVITDFLLANKSVPIGEDSVLRQTINETEALTLSYLDRVISFEFAALDFRAPQKNRYRYRLDGFDPAWTETGSDRRLVTYTNLDPGDYTFRVLGSNSDGIWNETGAALAFTVTPPWWQTIWFRTSALMLVVGFVVGGYLRQRRSAALQQRTLEKMVVERTEELQDARTQIRALFNDSPLGICVINLDGRIVGANGAMQRIAGYDEEELLQSDIQAHFIDPDQRTQVMLTLNTEGFVSNYGTQLRRKDGTIYHGNLTISRLQMGRQDMMLGVVDDVTERIKNRESLASLYRNSMELVSITNIQSLVDSAFEYLYAILNFDCAALLMNGRVEREAAALVYLPTPLAPRLALQQIPVSSWPFSHASLNIRETTYIPDIRTSTVFAPHPHGQQADSLEDAFNGCRSWLCLPLLAGERTIGWLNIVHNSADHFEQNAIDVARTFANQVAIAIDNIQLHEQRQRTAAAEERSRIARDLHDSVTQTLFTASIMAEATPHLWDRDQSIARQNLDQLSTLIRSALAEMRSLLLEMRSGKLSDQSLSELLHTLAEAMHGRSNILFAINVEVDFELPADVVMAFYRITQESVNNVIKHAEATRVDISVLDHDDAVELHIQDDGRGFDRQAIPAGHMGLNIMIERAERIGGDVHIRSTPGQGTRVMVHWPKPMEGRSDE